MRCIEVPFAITSFAPSSRAAWRGCAAAFCKVGLKAISNAGNGSPLKLGNATVVERGERSFEPLLHKLRSTLSPRIRAIVTISVDRALPLTSPVYDDGKSEAEIRRGWTARFRRLQPNERFEE